MVNKWLESIKDVENAPFEYEETDKDIPKIDKESKEINLSNKEME